MGLFQVILLIFSLFLITCLIIYRSYKKKVNQKKMKEIYEKMDFYDHKLYWEDLNQKSLLGALYQKLFLYPMLTKHITGKLIDVGAGLGDMCVYYKNSVAADINKFSVENYKKRNLENILIEDNKINYSDGTFDTALMDNVLEHISNPNPLLLEIRRILKKDGKLIIGVPGIKGYKSDFDHKVFYDEEKLENLLSSLKFETINKFYMPLKSNYLNQNLNLYCLYSISEKKGQL